MENQKTNCSGQFKVAHPSAVINYLPINLNLIWNVLCVGADSKWGVCLNFKAGSMHGNDWMNPQSGLTVGQNNEQVFPSGTNSPKKDHGQNSTVPAYLVISNLTLATWVWWNSMDPFLCGESQYLWLWPANSVQETCKGDKKNPDSLEWFRIATLPQ